jgi:hypothetical protein
VYAHVAHTPVVQEVQQVQQVQAAPKVHKIFTNSGNTHLRLEEYRSGPQVIRVQEEPAQAPEVVRVQAPADQQSLVRVVNRGAGATAERVIHRGQAQAHTVSKPAGPGVRIVQAIKGQAPAPRVEFYNEDSEGSEHHFTDANSQVVDDGASDFSGGSVAYAAAPVAYTKTIQAAPTYIKTIQSAPTYLKTVHSAPTYVSAVHSAPSYLKTINY